MQKPVNADPTKEFFVEMITRDIDLSDCVLDLLDNSIDGARYDLARLNRPSDIGGGTDHKPFMGYFADVSFDQQGFLIKDNCGGISIERATKYAFRFGRDKDTPFDVNGAIGLYGIGMKRAILKMGRHITIQSSTVDEAFEVVIDVRKWLEKHDWDFELRVIPVWEVPGTSVKVSNLRNRIKREFEDKVFSGELKRIIERDYAFILASGFSIELNGVEAERYKYQLRDSKDIKPLRESYTDESGVKVEIAAGMADVPPEDSSAEEMQDEGRRETSYFGWFVTLNNRVVLAADRTARTVWGDEGFTRWHQQYNGFMGIVMFYSDDPDLLPWTTTKRDVEESSLVYRRAVAKMKNATQPWIRYTTTRKRDLVKAKYIERSAVAKPIEDIAIRQTMLLPKISKEPAVRMANILYQKPYSQVNKLRKSLGKPRMSYTEVGRITFEYFMEHEVED